jgi:hypothetical protein
MFAAELLIAWEYPGTGAAIVIALVLAMALLLPYLVNEIRRGKARQRGFPVGEGDTHPGTRSNPAPGQPDGQPDPYDARAQR